MNDRVALCHVNIPPYGQQCAEPATGYDGFCSKHRHPAYAFDRWSQRDLRWLVHQVRRIRRQQERAHRKASA